MKKFSEWETINERFNPSPLLPDHIQYVQSKLFKGERLFPSDFDDVIRYAKMKSKTLNNSFNFKSLNDLFNTVKRHVLTINRTPENLWDGFIFNENGVSFNRFSSKLEWIPASAEDKILDFLNRRMLNTIIELAVGNQIGSFNNPSEDIIQYY